MFLIQEKIILFFIYIFLLAWETELFICMNISDGFLSGSLQTQSKFFQELQKGFGFDDVDNSDDDSDNGDDDDGDSDHEDEDDEDDEEASPCQPDWVFQKLQRASD